MGNFRKVFQEVRARTGMYIPDPTYASVCCFILGFDTACDGGVLVGFREWLVPRVGFGSNLTWASLALYAIFPGVKDPASTLSLVPGGEKEAIDRLFQLIDELDDARSAPDGMRRIFASYEAWLRGQDWYRPGSPSWIDPAT